MNIRVRFDGGCSPNPGRKYGSYRIDADGFVLSESRFDLGHGTNNEAEFESLNRALVKLTEYLKSIGEPLYMSAVVVETDSKIMWYRLAKKNRIHNNPKMRNRSARMFELANGILSLLKPFSSFTVTLET